MSRTTTTLIVNVLSAEACKKTAVMCACIHKQTLIIRNATCADVKAAEFYSSPDYQSHPESWLVPMRAQVGLGWVGWIFQLPNVEPRIYVLLLFFSSDVT